MSPKIADVPREAATVAAPAAAGAVLCGWPWM